MLSAISFGSLAGLIWLFAANQGMKNNLKVEDISIFIPLERTKNYTKKTQSQKYRRYDFQYAG